MYDSDDDDDEADSDNEEDRMEDIQEVVNEDNRSEASRGAEDGDREDIGDDVFDDDDFDDEETAAERIEHELRGDEIKEDADLMARQLLHIVEELNQVKRCPSGHRHLLELPRMGINHVLAWHRHVERRDTVRSARVMRSTFARVRSGNMFAN